jgi:CheY-like chemotaxis protein
MSHEMRTPLNGMVGMLEIALRGELSTAQRDQLQTAHASAEALLYLINDILEFSKIDAGKLGLEIAPFRLRDTLAAALRAHAGAAHEKNLELVLRVAQDVPECLLGDARRLCQVVSNLLGNAIKFTARGQIELELQSVARAGPRALLRASVSDTGMGVAKDKQRQIFEAFAQADETTTRRFGGTGLGLAICAELVQLMGGSLDVESEPGQGARFFFTFAIEVDEAAERERFRPPFSAARVLLIEPHAGHREFLCALLEEWGLEVHTSAPLEAASRLRDAARRGAGFALLIIDSDGVAHLGASFFSRLRSSIGELCPSLQLTRARFARAARGPGAELGSLELSKPVAPSALLEGIAGLLGVRAEPAPKPVTAGPAAAPLSVLLAEDNEVNRRVAQFLLEDAGCRVTPVMDGKQALEALAAQRFDVVLMDGHMPEMDGLEAVGVLRARERESGGRTPVIALTAQAMHGDRERYLAAGMDAYLSKPFTGSVLIATVREVVARAAARAAGGPDTGARGLAQFARGAPAALAVDASSAVVGPDTTSPAPATDTSWPAPVQASRAGGAPPALGASSAAGEPRASSAGPAPGAASVAAADASSSPPAYARARLLDRVGGNESLLRQMVQVFWEEAPELLRAVSAALEAGDARQLERAAHKCVGAFLTIGAEAAGRTARSLEIAGRAGELARAPAMAATLTSELRALEQAFVTAGDLATDQRAAPPAARMAR